MSDDEFQGSMADIIAHQESQREPKYPNIKYVPDYQGHWHGPAWFTGHPYGVQVHSTLGDAERWIEGRRALNLEHPADCVTCCEVAEFTHSYRHPDSHQGYQTGDRYC